MGDRALDRAIVDRVVSRRGALRAGSTGIAAALGAAGLGRSAAAGPATPAAPPQPADLAREIVAVFSRLPGRKALKLWAPGEAGVAEWSATLNSGTPLFVASAFKAFVLAEYLRQAEAAVDPVGAVPLRQQLAAQLAEQW